jgi:hypothetical protein
MGATSTLHESSSYRRRRRWSTAVAIVASGSLLLVACGGSDDGEDTSTTTESAGSDSTVLDATSTTTATTTTSATTASGEFEYVTEGAVVVVANASRVNGAAGLLSDGLGAVGFTVTEPTNSADDVENIETTQIFYSPGDAAAQAVAENLRLAFGGGDIVVEEVAVPAPTESGNLGEGTVLVLLGNDVAGKTLEEIRSPAVARDAAENDGTTAPPTTSPPA